MDTANEQMLNTYINSRPSVLTKTTISNYVSLVKRVQNIMPKSKSIQEHTIQEIISALYKSTMPSSMVAKFLLIYKQFVDEVGASVIDKHLIKLSKETTEHIKTRTKNQLDKSEVKYKDLLELLEKLTGEDYLMLYLLTKYGVRNKDLVAIYTDDKELINQVLNGVVRQNIFYFLDDKLYYSRSNYKTFDNYGTITIHIKDDKFITILKTIKEIGDDIFVKKNGNSFGEAEIHNLIKRRLNKHLEKSNLSEGLIYKMIVEHFKGDDAKLLKISKTRGHMSATQENNYTE